MQGIENDSLAPISESGRAVQKEINAYLRAKGYVPTQIWHSPVLRAQQTAELIGEDFQVPLQPELSLSEYFDELDILNKLAQAPDNSTIFLVSHGPQLFRLSGFLIGYTLLKSPLQNSSALVLEFQDKVVAGAARYVELFTSHDAKLHKGKLF